MKKIEKNDEAAKPDDLLPLFDHESDVSKTADQPEEQSASNPQSVKITGLSELTKKATHHDPAPGSQLPPAEEPALDKQPAEKVKTLHHVDLEERPRRGGKTLADELSKKKKIDISFGESLCEMRIQRNLSIDEVSNATKIRKDYIKALENEDFSRLPPAVFVCGYVRKMCELYAIPADTAGAIITSLKENSEYRLSEECIDNIIEQDDDINPDLEPRIKSIMWLAGGVVLFIIMLIIAITIFSFSGEQKQPAPEDNATAVATPAQFDPEALNKLSPKKIPDAAELPVPK